MQFRLLGPVAVESEGSPLPLGSGRERLVLSVLLLAADRLTSADHLVDAVWESPPPTARQQLQNLIAGLRRRLGEHDPGLIVTRPFGYELRLGTHSLDTTRFRQLVREAQLAQGRGRPEDARQAYEEALDLWRGDVLADVPDPVEREVRLALEGERRAALDALLDVLLRLGHADDVLARVVEPLAADPWNERLHAHRIRALAASGRRAEAIEAYLALRRSLIDELGVEPGALLVDLNDQVVQGIEELPGTAPAPGPVPRELPPATWRLFGRDQLVASVVEALREAAGTGSGTPPTVGGAAPEAVAAGASGAAGPPTVVLAGVGGVGKSSVAVTVGHLVGADHPDGTLWIPLGESAFADPSDALARALRSLDVAPRDVPPDLPGRTALYRSILAERRVLVVLDGATSEAQVRPLLPTAAGSAALITSRRKLSGLVGAVRHTLPPLDADSSAALLGALAGPGRLASEPDEVARIGELCGHLPLALCVVGARLAANEHLLLGDLRSRLGRERARLDELATGDIDVRASIMTSVEGLGERARVLFGRLSLGPVDDWPAWVAQELSQEPSWMRDLDELVDLHLVEPTGRDAAGQPRFRMLGPVGELSAELQAGARTTSPSDAELRRRLLDVWEHLARLADSAQDGSEAHGDAEAPPREAGARRAPREWFEVERPHLVAAVLSTGRPGGGDPAADRSEPAASAERAVRLALDVSAFLATRAYDDDRERVLRHALDLLPDDAAPDLEVGVLHALFAVLAQRRQLDELPALARRQLEAARRAPGRVGEAGALTQAGWAAQALGRFGEAADWFDRAARLAEEQDDDLARVTARAQTGVVLRNAGRADAADPMLAEMVAHVRAHGSPRSTCIWLVTRAEGLVDLGRPAEADDLLAEALAIATRLGDELGAAHCRLARAAVRVCTGDADAATEQVTLAKDVLDAHAPGGVAPEVLRVLADISALRGDRGEAGAHLLEAVRLRRSRDAGVEVARDLARLALLDRVGAVEERPDAVTGGVADAVSAFDEVDAVLADLGLDRRALRLPRLYGPVPAPPT